MDQFVDNHDLCIIGTRSAITFQKVEKAHGKFPKKFMMVNPLEE